MSFINVKGLSHKFNIKDKDGNKIGENWAIKDVDFLADKGGDNRDPWQKRFREVYVCKTFEWTACTA